MQQAFPGHLKEADWGAHQAAFTTLAFDCNPTHFVTPRGPPVTHNALAPQRLCPNVVRYLGLRMTYPPGALMTTQSRCKVTPSFRIDPSKGFPVRAVLPGPRAFFCVRNSRACLPVRPSSRIGLHPADLAANLHLRETRSYKGKSAPRRLPR